jgi:hypothetical protein
VNKSQWQPCRGAGGRLSPDESARARQTAADFLAKFFGITVNWPTFRKILVDIFRQ